MSTIMVPNTVRCLIALACKTRRGLASTGRELYDSLFLVKRLFYTKFKNPIDMKKVNTGALRAEIRTEINSARIVNTPKEAMPMWERKLLSSMKQSSTHKGERIR
jgi:hypothetical protein